MFQYCVNWIGKVKAMRVLIINPNSDQETADVLSKTAQSFLEDRGEFDVVSMRTAPKLVGT